MAKQHGNSGRGTDGPAPRMSDDERQKSAETRRRDESRGAKQSLPVGKQERGAAKPQADRSRRPG